MYPLKLKPIFKDYIWGGTTLKTEFLFESALNPLAEAWLLSSHKDGLNVIENGEFSGLTLDEYRDKFNPTCYGQNKTELSILIKLIDAQKNLSVQVHPDDDYALKYENEHGKNEMWYILDCKENSYIYYGLKSKTTKEEFENSIANGSVTDLLNKVYVKKGDCIYIEAGTVHAIGEGILLAEIQQSSNTTYRIFDYNRVDLCGNPRKLHISQSVDVSILDVASKKVENYFNDNNCCIANNNYFTVNKTILNGTLTLTVNENSFLSIVILDGQAFIDGVDVKKGDSIFLPAGYGKVILSGNATIIESGY